MTVCERIDRELKRRNLSRRQLAIMAGIPPSSLQSAMQRNGNLSLDMVFKIADALEIPAPSLLDNSSERAADETRALGIKLSRTLAEYEAAKKRGAPKEELVRLMEKCTTLGMEANQRAQESILLREFQRLNSPGKDAALGYVKALAEMPEYQDKVSEVSHVLTEKSPKVTEERPVAQPQSGQDGGEEDSGEK